MKRRKGYGAVIGVVFVTLFLLGLVIGMIIVHIADRDRENKLRADYETKMEEIRKEAERIEETTRVYVPQRKRILGMVPLNSYSRNGEFVLEDGFMAYYNENGEKISHLGIDLSYHQQSVNWDELKASPVEFVMLRCGYRGYLEGGLIEDEKFREYAKKCNEYGINLGIYFFTQAITVEEAEREAEFVIDLIKDYKISYPVAFDTEYISDESARTNTNEISKELRSDMINAFCEKIKEAGYYPMVYASENWFRRNMDVEAVQEYDFWAPQYLEDNDFLYDFTIWQYTDSGNIPGINTVVDLDISMVDYSEFVPALREAVVGNGIIQSIEESPGNLEILDNTLENLETAENGEN